MGFLAVCETGRYRLQRDIVTIKIAKYALQVNITPLPLRVKLTDYLPTISYQYFFRVASHCIHDNIILWPQMVTFGIFHSLT